MVAFMHKSRLALVGLVLLALFVALGTTDETSLPDPSESQTNPRTIHADKPEDRFPHAPRRSRHCLYYGCPDDPSKKTGSSEALETQQEAQEQEENPKNSAASVPKRSRHCLYYECAEDTKETTKQPTKPKMGRWAREQGMKEKASVQNTSEMDDEVNQPINLPTIIDLSKIVITIAVLIITVLYRFSYKKKEISAPENAVEALPEEPNRTQADPVAQNNRAPIIEDLHENSDDLDVESTSLDEVTEAEESNDDNAASLELKSKILTVISDQQSQSDEISSSGSEISSSSSAPSAGFDEDAQLTQVENDIISSQLSKLLELRSEVDESSDLNAKILYHTKVTSLVQKRLLIRKSLRIMDIQSQSQSELVRLQEERNEQQRLADAEQSKYREEKERLQKLKHEQELQEKDLTRRKTQLSRTVTLAGYCLIACWLCGIHLQQGLATTLLSELWTLFTDTPASLRNCWGLGWFCALPGVSLICDVIILLFFIAIELLAIKIVGNFLPLLATVFAGLMYRLMTQTLLLLGTFGVTCAIAWLLLLYLPSKKQIRSESVQKRDNSVWIMVLCVATPALMGFCLGFFNPPAVSAPKVVPDTINPFYGKFDTLSNVIPSKEKASKWATATWSKLKHSYNNRPVKEESQ